MVGTSPLAQGVTEETLFKTLPSTLQAMFLLIQGSLARTPLHVTIYYTLRHDYALTLEFYNLSVVMQCIQEDCYEWNGGGPGPVS